MPPTSPPFPFLLLLTSLAVHPNMPSSKVIPIPMSLERTGLLPAYQNILSVLSSKTSPAYHTKTGVYKVALDILRARLEEHGKAESIQRIHRGRKARRDLEEKKEAAVRLQGGEFHLDKWGGEQ